MRTNPHPQTVIIHPWVLKCQVFGNASTGCRELPVCIDAFTREVQSNIPGWCLAALGSCLASRIWGGLGGRQEWLIASDWSHDSKAARVSVSPGEPCKNCPRLARIQP